MYFNAMYKSDTYGMEIILQYIRFGYLEVTEVQMPRHSFVLFMGSLKKVTSACRSSGAMDLEDMGSSMGPICYSVNFMHLLHGSAQSSRAFREKLHTLWLP